MHLTTDEDAKTTLKKMKEYCESLIREIENRFNDKSIDMTFASHFKSFQTFIDIQDTELKKICGYFPMLNAEAVLADMKSFNFFIKSMLDSGIYKVHESPLIKIIEADMGYTELQQLCEILLVIPVTTASVERSFSTMNRVLTKTRKRMLPGTLMYCMLINIEGPDIPTEDFLNKTVDLYAAKKNRRIRFL